MAGMASEGTQYDPGQFDTKMNAILGREGEETFYTTYDDVCISFDAMELRSDLLRGIYAYGFEKPSAIQQRGIIPFCKGLDVIQQAQSGTGKTATYDEICDSFDAMGLKSHLLRGIYAYGFEKPSAIQQKGLDVIQQAQSGTGKTATYDEVCDSFDAMGLTSDLLRGIYAYGFEKPSAIQQKGLDVIQQAQSGTGKTATICSGVLWHSRI